MKIIKYALLLSGLFFSFYLLAEEPETGFCSTGDVEVGVGCIISAQTNDVYSWQAVNPSGVIKNFDHSVLDKAKEASCGWYLSFISNRNIYTCTTKGGYTVRECNLATDSSGKNYCASYKAPDYRNVPGSVVIRPNQPNCDFDSEAFKPFQRLVKIGQVWKCAKNFDPRPPLDCSALKGVGSSMTNDYFITDPAAGYTQENPPSCVTKTAKDENGVQRSGDCKVVAGRWGQLNTPEGVKWWPLAGTFTGAACGETESATPDPDPPKCWETTNGLDMCIEDPAEKCTTVNGIQQCQAGCGYVNGDFYCKAKDNAKPDPNEKDKPIPDSDDQISDPTKPLQDMKKGDFKDVQKGVESRVGQVVTGIGNLENSVDSLGEKLDQVVDALEYSNGTEEAANNLLRGIKDGTDKITADKGGNGDGQGGDGEGDGQGECKPEETDCGDDGDAGGIVSWWNSPYEDGFSGMVQENIDDFQETELYKSLTDEIKTNSSQQPNLEMCFNFGFADFGCQSLNIPAWILGFIKACFLYYAAILARRMLIGA